LRGFIQDGGKTDVRFGLTADLTILGAVSNLDLAISTAAGP